MSTKLKISSNLSSMKFMNRSNDKITKEKYKPQPETTWSLEKNVKKGVVIECNPSFMAILPTTYGRQIYGNFKSKENHKDDDKDITDLTLAESTSKSKSTPQNDRFFDMDEKLRRSSSGKGQGRKRVVNRDNQNTPLKRSKTDS